MLICLTTCYVDKVMTGLHFLLKDVEAEID